MIKTIKKTIKIIKFWLNPKLFYKENPYFLEKWSKLISERYNYKCCKCGVRSKGKRHDAHHIMPKSIYPKLVYRLDNGALLCRVCHDKYHKTHDLKTEVNRKTLLKFINQTD